MGNYGIKITKPSADASSIEPQDYIVWSKYKHLKITKRISGQLSITNGNTSASGSISHGLTYEPAFLCYFLYPIDNEYWWLVGTDQGTSSSWGFDSEFDTACQPDKEKFNLNVSRGSDTAGTNDFPYVIYVFDQPAATGASGEGKPPGYINSDHGLKVSQEGIDVRTSKIYEQMINSNADHLKYHDTFTGSLSYDTTSGGTDDDQIAHGLPYTPLFVVYAKTHPSLSYYRAVPCGKAPAPFILSAASKEDNILVEIVWAGSESPSSGTIYYRVVVFKNRMIG